MNVRRFRPGFTLIELLIFIAIIAILSAILFPLFLKARAIARTARCQSNQSQLCKALMLYVDAYQGKMPSRRFLAFDAAPGGGYIAIYEPYVKNHDIIMCPESSRYIGIDGKPTVGRQAYSYNECLIGQLASTYDGPTECHFISDFNRATASGSGRAIGSVVNPSKTPAFFDAFPYKQSSIYPPTGWGWQPEDSVNKNRMTNPHSMGSNYAFLDGHVKWLLPALPKYYQATAGLDYDGNGTVGDANMLR